MRTLTAVRRDIVQTIRQVVDVVSQYAGGALPEPARGRVRGFILELPQRWAKKAPGTEEGERDREWDRDKGRESVAAASGSAVSVRRGNRRTAGHRERGRAGSSAASSRAASPITSMRSSRHQDEGGESVSASAAILAAQRILTLATESLDMVRGVTGVVKDSLDRADACVSWIRGFPCIDNIYLINSWVGRLRTVGIQRASSQEGVPVEDGGPPSSNASALDGSETDPEIELTQNSGHRRVNSIASSFDESDAGTTFSGSSSYAGGSSVPSTPGFSSGPHIHNGYVYAGGPGSPGVMGLEAMNLGGSRSRISTPKNSVVGLLDEDDEESIGKGRGVDGSIKIVGMDVEVGEGTGRGDEERGMDIDEY
jgi:transcriptional repressor OPI1